MLLLVCREEHCILFLSTEVEQELMLWFLHFTDLQLNESVRVNTFHRLLLAEYRPLSFICLLYVYDFELNSLRLFVIVIIIRVADHLALR